FDKDDCREKKVVLLLPPVHSSALNRDDLIEMIVEMTLSFSVSMATLASFCFESLDSIS
ncbi:hypothetical protein A2U01_0084440, partial [Trifolium medium]|nr:hypothetical protein [Trifolium medium]